MSGTPPLVNLATEALAVLTRLAAAIEALTGRVEALTGGKAPETPEYADPKRVRAWASQFNVEISEISETSIEVTFDDIARVNTGRMKYGRPPFVLRTTP